MSNTIRQHTDSDMKKKNLTSSETITNRTVSFLHELQAKFRELAASVYKRAKFLNLLPDPNSRADAQVLEKIGTLIPNTGRYEQQSLLKQIRIRAGQKGHRSLESYYRELTKNPEELDILKEKLTYVGSHFFRGAVWADLKAYCRDLSGNIEPGQKFRVWCAGCSSGKEVYSVLMVLADLFPADRIDLLATDYNTEMLSKCREAVYTYNRFHEIPEEYRHYTEKYTPESREEDNDSGEFRIRGELRDAVRTQKQDLLMDEYPAGFDLILCRNVIKFFRENVRTEVEQKLADALNPGGLLVLSDEVPQEMIADPGSMHLTSTGTKGIYRKNAD